MYESLHFVHPSEQTKNPSADNPFDRDHTLSLTVKLVIIATNNVPLSS